MVSSMSTNQNRGKAAGIRAWFDQTLLGALFSADEEELRRHLVSEFDETKRLSDFAGMVVRFGFLVLATSYFGQKIVTPEGFRWLTVYLPCLVFFFGFSIVFAGRILSVMFAYFVLDGAGTSSRAGKVTVFVSCVVTTLILYAGIYFLAIDLARASSLSP